MAWFQNLTVKAGDLLNKIDQNTAKILNEPTSELIDNVPKNPEEPFATKVSDDRLNLKKSNSDVSIVMENTTLENSLANIANEDAHVSTDNVSVLDEISKSAENSLIEIAFSGSSLKNQSTPTTESCDNKTSKEQLVESGTTVSVPDFIGSSFAPPDERQTNNDENIAKLELENQELNNRLLNLHHLYSELENENVNIQNQVERANEAVVAAQNEMEQYRARAQRILQEKEKVISLKEGHYVSDENKNKSVIATYNQELKKELEFQQEKNSELSRKCQSLTDELTVLQQKEILLQKDTEQSLRNLQEILDKERTYRNALEEEYETKTKKLNQALQELEQQSNIAKTIKQDLLSIKEQMRERSNNKMNDDLESRLHSLTQTLLTKQNTLESVTTERNALRLQLEKFEHEHHQRLTQRTEVKVINVNDTDDAKAQVPHFMKISPFDAGVTRKVKHAYSTLDTISVRTGIFLRRYPVARVFVFCYMVIRILLHIWVLIILFSYTP